MVTPANPGLMTLHALFMDTSESHARRGAHLRVAHHPMLSLPRFPFIVERAKISPNEFEHGLRFRDDAVWETVEGQRLFPPFNMTKDQEVIVTLPSGGDRALWAEILLAPDVDLPTRPIPTLPNTPPVVLPRGGSGGINIRPGLGRFLGNRRLSNDERIITRGTNPTIDPDFLSRILNRNRAGGFEVEAFLNSVTGAPRPLGKRATVPYAFSGPGLVRFHLRGAAQIAGIRWLDQNLQNQKGLEWQVIDVLNLPHEGGSRYAKLQDWQQLCAQRVDLQTPKRRPLQDTTALSSPGAAPFHNPAQEFDRVETLFDGVETPLNELIVDSTPQHLQVQRTELTRDGTNNVVTGGSAEATVPSLALAMHAITDPGLASWMGYKTRDHELADDPEVRLSVFRIRGYFVNPSNSAVTAGGWSFMIQIMGLQNGNQQKSFDEIVKDFQIANGWLDNNGSRLIDLPDPFTGYILGSYAIADHEAPLMPLAAPELTSPRHVSWVSSAGAAAPRRVTETEVRRLPAAGAMAVGMRQPAGPGALIPLTSGHDIGKGTWRTVMLPSIMEPALDSDPLAPGETEPDAYITHAQSSPETLSMHVSAMDRFGRYSPWGNTTGPAGPRPKPPRPVLLGAYRQPTIDSGLRAGDITFTVPLPPADALAPGAFPLSHAEVTVEVEGSAFAASPYNLPIAAAVSIHPDTGTPRGPVPTAEDRFGVRDTITGPNIPANQERQLRLTAIWRDTAGQASAVSEPVNITMRDPYPPAQIPIPDILDYSARPDATNRAWVEREIAGASSNVSYAVYYADENRLRDYLRQSGDGADASLLAQLEGEPDLAARATLLRSNQTRFPGYLFERLQDVIDTSLAPARFRHALPGTLRVLSAYKVAVEAEANAAGPDLSGIDTVFYAVPNSDPPAQPTVSVKLVPPETGEPDLVAEVTVTLRPGLTQGAVARIRRTRSGVVDPVRNPVVVTAPFGPPDSVTGLQTATYRDTGPALIAPAASLAAFVKYAWLAEAQGADEPGSAASAGGAVPGLWGVPSAPASLTLVPDEPPAAPMIVSHTASVISAGTEVTNITLDLSYPLDLTPGTPGPWRIRVERLQPDATVELISEDPAQAGTSISINSADILPRGTRYRVRVIDPVGRASTPVEQEFS